MIKDIRPIDYELMHVYITSDGKRHFTLKKSWNPSKKAYCKTQRKTAVIVFTIPRIGTM